MKPVIKQASAADAKLLADLGAEIFYKTFAEQNTAENMQLYLAANFTEQKLSEEFRQQGALFYIAYVGDVPAGYAKLSISRVPEAIGAQQAMEVERLYVHPQFQNQKIGYELMQHCIATAKAKGYKILWLGVWEHHPNAIRFYERVGFSKFGEHVFQLGKDPQTDWLMKLDIA